MGYSGFNINLWGLFLALLLLLLIFLFKRLAPTPQKPHLLFSDLSLIKEPHPSWKLQIATWPQKLSTAAFTLLLLALIDPHFYKAQKENESETHEGIAFYLLVDQSGSMASKMAKTNKPQPTKLNWLKEITQKFLLGDASVGLEGRRNDLIGLIAFARKAQVLSPLTTDHTRILQELQQLEPVKEENEDGTAIGYALYKTTNIIAATRHYLQDSPEGNRPPYEIKNSTIILITDGFDSPHPDDLAHPLRGMGPMQAALYAKERQVRIYIINIEPALSSPKFAPQRHLMEDVAKTTGGKYYFVTTGNDLLPIYTEIDRLEKSKLPLQSETEQEFRAEDKVSLSPHLIAIGLLLLLLGFFLDTFCIRRFP